VAIRVVPAEDNLLVREGVRRLLEMRNDASIAARARTLGLLEPYIWRVHPWINPQVEADQPIAGGDSVHH